MTKGGPKQWAPGGKRERQQEEVEINRKGKRGEGENMDTRDKEVVVVREKQMTCVVSGETRDGHTATTLVCTDVTTVREAIAAALGTTVRNQRKKAIERHM